MKIWRVENIDGIGCYRNRNTKEILHRHITSRETPNPYEDIGINRSLKKNEICGFLNIEQARKWFNKIELIALKKIGYSLKQIEVLKITAIGKTQVLAIK